MTLHFLNDVANDVGQRKIDKFMRGGGEELTSWLSFVVSICEFCHFPIGILSQMWYLIDS